MSSLAWVNWNPDPLRHAFGATMPRGRTVGLCRVMVRIETDAAFDPSDDRSCPECAEFVRSGLTWVDVKDRPTIVGPNTIVCRGGVS